MTLTYKVSRADYKAFWWRSLFHWKAIKQIIFIWLFFSVIVVLDDYNEFQDQREWLIILINKLLISTGITAVTLIIFLFRWRKYPLFNGPVGNCEMTVKPDCFILTDQNNLKYVFAIHQLRFVSQNRDLLFLYFGSREGFPLPKNAFRYRDLADQFYRGMEDVKRNNLPYISEETIRKIFES